jgi:nucleoid DNA-binding protein
MNEKQDRDKKEKTKHHVKAIYAYAPRVKIDKVIELDQMVTYIADRTGFNEGVVIGVLAELRDSVAFYAKGGNSVRLRGLGLFSPRISLNGEFSINYKPDKRLKNILNEPDAFWGEVVNSDMIGKTSDQLIDRWNEEHPDEPVKKK